MNNINIHEIIKYVQGLTKNKNLTQSEIILISHVYSVLSQPFQFKKYFKQIKDLDADTKNEIIFSHDINLYRNINYKDYFNDYESKKFSSELFLNFLGNNNLKLAANYFNKSNFIKTNWDFKNTKYLFFDFDFEDIDSPEVGLFFVYLPIIQYFKNTYKIKKIYVCVTEKLNGLLNRYFPYIENVKPKDVEYVKSKINFIGRHYSYLKFFNMSNCHSILKKEIENIRNIIIENKKQSNKLGFLWYSNAMESQCKTIPIGVLINTLGNNKKNLNLKCLQYNDAQEEIELFNKESTNKISDIFYNDLDTDICDIVDAVVDCKAIVGTSNFVLIANCLGIPALLTSSTPHHHWYASSYILPHLSTTNMNFSGDYEGLYKSIYDFVDKHFD